MEPDKFDRLFSKKLEEADVPSYSESSWRSFRDKIPYGSSHVNLTNLGLVALLILSNSWWAWNTLGSEDQNGEVMGNSNKSLSEIIDFDYQVVTVYDTIIEEVIINESRNRVSSLMTTQQAQNPGAQQNTFAEVDHSSGIMVEEDDNMVNQELVQLNSEENVSLDKPDETKSDTEKELKQKKDEKPHEEKSDKTTGVIPHKDRQPYSGLRWLAGLDFYKPYHTKEDITKDYEGSGLGVNVEYIFNEWFSLSAEAGRWNQSYLIMDPEFYNDVREESDQSGGVYGGGTYGSAYTWLNSEVQVSDIQLGLVMKISPPLGLDRLRPFGSIGFMHGFRNQTDVYSRLEEDGTGKVVKVESFFPDDNGNNKYFRYEAGLEGQISPVWGLRLSADFMQKLEGNEYEYDLIVLKGGIIYVIK